MDRIIQLVTDRNNYLEKFIELNESELANFKSDNFDGVEKFYETRDKILNLLNKIEDLLSVELDGFNQSGQFSVNDKKVISSQMNKKEELTQKIIEQDIELISLLDLEKKKIYSQVQSIKKGRKVISAYKSKSSPDL